LRRQKLANVESLLHRGAENFWRYFFLAGDLNEIPRRIAAFFMDSDDRSVSLTTSERAAERCFRCGVVWSADSSSRPFDRQFRGYWFFPAAQFS
jgi:hypothetical protein